MKRNRIVKRELITAFQARCMLTGLYAKESQLQFHHMNKKEWGGREEFYNGLLVVDAIHKWVHIIEEQDIELYDLIQECADYYKGCLEYGDVVSAQMYEDEVMPIYRAICFKYEEQHPQHCKIKRRRR